MNKLRIPHDAIVFVGDGHKALFLRNAGDEKFPNLVTEQVLIDDNPPSHDQGTDRPGRAFKRAHTNLRSGMDETDWHEVEKHRFARHVAAAIEELVRARRMKALVIAAPARTLAELRRSFNVEVRDHIIAEIDKDLTKHPVGEIEKHLLAE